MLRAYCLTSLLLLALRAGCASGPTPVTLPTSTRAPEGGAATASPATVIAPTAAVDPRAEIDPAATAKVQTAVVAETAAAATLQVVTATPAAPVVTTLEMWPEDLLWLPAGQTFLGTASPTPLLAARSLNSITVINPTDGVASAPVVVPIPDTATALSPDGATLLALADGGPTKTAPTGPGPFPVNAYGLDGALRFRLPDARLYSVNYTQDGKYIVGQVEGSGPTVHLYDPADGKLLRELTGFQTAAPVFTAFVTPGGQTLVWQSRGTIQLQDVESGAMGASMNYQDFVNALAFSPDGARMAVAVENQLILYRLPDGAEIARVGLSQPVAGLTFSPDGKTLAAGYGADIQLWHGETLAPGALLRGPNTFTSMVRFSPDGQYLAALHEGQMLTIRAIILE